MTERDLLDRLAAVRPEDGKDRRFLERLQLVMALASATFWLAGADERHG